MGKTDTVYIPESILAWVARALVFIPKTISWIIVMNFRVHSEELNLLKEMSALWLQL
jgi:hypothetical protein